MQFEDAEMNTILCHLSLLLNEWWYTDLEQPLGTQVPLHAEQPLLASVQMDAEVIV